MITSRSKLVIAASLFAAACGGQPVAVNAPQNAAPAAAAASESGQTFSALLMNPDMAKSQAPNVYKVRFSTTKGDFVVQVNRDWAPMGADRFYNLVRAGYYDGDAFFRVIQGFMVQFGINGAPAVNAKWRTAAIDDDPAMGHSNSRGMVTFATAGPNTRTTQVFINYVDNRNLDGMGFVPFGQVVEGMSVVDGLYGGYGEGAPSGQGPDQGRLQAQGNDYLKSSFPNLDYINTAAIQ